MTQVFIKTREDVKKSISEKAVKVNTEIRILEMEKRIAVLEKIVKEKRG